MKNPSALILSASSSRPFLMLHSPFEVTNNQVLQDEFVGHQSLHNQVKATPVPLAPLIINTSIIMKQKTKISNFDKNLLFCCDVKNRNQNI